ncbi:MAG: exodeoxyribonuclease VII large subunit [Gammaproteobacteria bacterium]|nr:exodeoxyribonuclease VII large subunit [Gammaproteobacteria bacterium]
MLNKTPDKTNIYSVSELNTAVRELLEDNFPLIWVSAEISNFMQPKSGHMYLTLKDQLAQVRCAMFRGRNSRLNFTPENGMQVLVQAQLSLYEPRGDYQLIIQHMEPAGEGLLRQKFEQLKRKLEAEGLFAETAKQGLPTYPTCIGIITSPTGAALRDIISVTKRRAPNIPLIVYPTQVQGDNAKNEIVKAINAANQDEKCDALIITRGGGSLEDLWPFNEEIVARAIFASKIPIISGVGHEIDFTIADFVADQRAPTPSAAAELICPDNKELLNTLDYLNKKLNRAFLTNLQHLKLHLEHLVKRLQHPGKRLQQYSQQLDYLEQRLQQNINNLLNNKRANIQNLTRNLDALSPLATLNRGYAIATTMDNKIIRDSREVKKNEQINLRLKKGTIICRRDIP